MKINFRKIASVLTSAVMLSSTIGLAAAANYPAPFVKGGTADVALVWGSSAQASDLVAVTDITADLQAELASQTATSSSSSSSTSVEGGDFVRLAKSSDEFNLANTMSGVFGATVSDDDLTELLADGTYSNDENTEYDYEQTLTLSALALSHFADSDYNDKEPTIGFNIGSNTQVITYTLDFTTDAESDVVSGDLADLETTDINILGKSYYILDAKNGSTSGAAGTAYGKFTFLDSANTAIVAEGESTTVSIVDKEYAVGINFIGETSVKLDVDGQITNSLAEGETFKLSDGTYIGIKDILYTAKEAGISKVEFSIGTGKLEIENGQDVELNDEDIDGVQGNFTRASASTSGGKEKVDKLTLQWVTDEEVFITADSDLEMPGFGALQFSMGGFFTPVKEVTKVEYDGDDSIKLSVPIKDGTAKFNILYANASGEFTGIGKDSDELLATTNGTSIVFNATSGTDKWFVVSWNSSADAESYLLSATVDENNNKNRTTIKNEVTGQTVCADKAADDTCNIGSATLTVTSVYKAGSGKNVNFTGGSGVTFNKLYSKTGLKISLPYTGGNNVSTDEGYVNFSATNVNIAGHNQDSFYLFFTEENKDDTLAAGTKFNMTINDNSDGDLQVSDIETLRSEHEIGDTDTFESYVQSDLATKVSIMKSGDQDTAEVEYHGSESYADVFLTAVGAVVSSDGTTTSSGGTVKKLGSVAVSDAEVSSVSTKNLIVVGGSCVNSVASDLLGGALCGASFEETTGAGAGQFVIETFARSGGKVATLVAGYNAADTTNAAKYLTTQTVDTTAGKRYLGTSATSAELVTETAAAA